MNSLKNKKIITLDIFLDPVTANFAKNKLKQNGIESFLEDKNQVDLNPFEGIALKISSKDLKKSFEILSK